MKQRFYNLLTFFILLTVGHLSAYAQQTESIYGDVTKADVKMQYVYTMEEAFKQAREQKKPIFFNCFADWAIPCHGMNKFVFSDEKFCNYMNKHFINLFMDVSRGENKSIAQKYDIQTFAHFLVLNSDGDVLLRISGGRQKEELQRNVALALNPKTTLPGAEEIYRSGKRGKKEVFNYMNVLALAGNNEELFKKVNDEYMAMLSPKEYSRAENWTSFTSTIADRHSERFAYLIQHKKDFVKQNGEAKVNAFIEGQYYWDILGYALGQKEYDKMKVIELHNEIQKAGLPDTCSICRIYPIIQMRGERRFDELFAYLTANEEKLGMNKLYIDTSLDFNDISGETQGKIIRYLKSSIESTKEPGVAQQLKAFVYKLEHPNGIQFENGTLATAMRKAKAQGKLLFVDCYTTWCGPCRRMSNLVFVQDNVGAEFNKRFINIKVDMEQEEGRMLGKKHGITSYPTLLFMDGSGNIVKKVIGGQSASALLKIASEIPAP